MRIKPYYCKKCKKFKGRFQVTNVDGIDYNNCKYCGEKCITTKEYVECLINDSDPMKNNRIYVEKTTVPVVRVFNAVEVDADVVKNNTFELTSILKYDLAKKFSEEVTKYATLCEEEYDFIRNKYIYHFEIDVANKKDKSIDDFSYELIKKFARG